MEIKRVIRDGVKRPQNDGGGGEIGKGGGGVGDDDNGGGDGIESVMRRVKMISVQTIPIFSLSILSVNELH